MASTQPSAVISRLLDDDFLHERIGDAASGLRDAYQRARNQPPEKAVQDKAIYDRVRQAATSAIEASRRAFGVPEPEPPPRHRGLIALILLATGAVVFWAARRHDAAPGSGTPAGAQTTAV
jgi:ferric-dicitrate binding protein FerR (iron transport regulator)